MSQLQGMYVGSDYQQFGPTSDQEVLVDSPQFDIDIRSATPTIRMGTTTITEADVIAWKGHANDMIFFQTVGILFCFMLLLVALFTPAVLTHRHLKEVKKLLSPGQK